MSGKMKKLICALLAGTMLLSSASMLAFADDETPAENNAATATETAAPEATAEATAAPEATEATAAPEATEAPAADATTEATEAPVAATKYDSDNYYKKALALCQGLGIIKGDEKGNVNPENLVTRAEMAAIILRMLNNNSLTAYQNIFSDVSTSHWAADTVQTASALGIVNGFPGGTFVPDGDVQYEQIAKMIVCAMNYKDSAEYSGGYPNGYIKVASDLEVTKNAPGSVGVASERGVVIKMVYNALLADFNEPDGMQYGHQQYKKDRTLAEYAFGVKEEKGTLLGTAKTSLTNKKLVNDQVLIQSTTEKNEDPIIYNTALTGLEDILASNVTIYYREQNNGDQRELLAIAENTSRTETVTLDNDKIKDIEGFVMPGEAADEGSIKLYGTSKKYKLSKNINVIYNGSMIDEKEYETVKNYKENEKDPRFDVTSYSEFLLPVSGSIKLVENDSSKEGYDYMFIDSYETLLVSSSTNKKVTGKIKGKAANIDVDEESKELTISTVIGGIEAAPRNLKKNNVVSLKRSLDGETLDFVVTGETVTGSISSISKDTDNGKEKTTVTINGKKYEVDANLGDDDIKTGTQSTFYLDLFGRIGFVESLSADGLLQSGEKYGWLMNAYMSDNREDTMVTIMGTDGNAVTYSLASKVNYWDKNGQAKAATKEEVTEKLTNADAKGNLMIDTSIFPKLSGKGSGEGTIRLVKYKANQSNELTQLHVAISKASETSLSAAVTDTANYSGSNSQGSLVDGGYMLLEGMIEFVVPLKDKDASSAGNYKVSDANVSAYLVRENGIGKDCTFAEFKDKIYPQVVIQFVGSATEAADYHDYGSQGNPLFMYDHIETGYDEKEDKEVYTLVGYNGGSEVRYTTNARTILYDTHMASDPWRTETGVANAWINGTSRWNAVDNDDSIANYLHEGDIIGVGTGGNVLAVISCVEELGKKIVDKDKKAKQWMGYSRARGSATRDTFIFGQVASAELESDAILTVNAGGAQTTYFDAGKIIDTAVIVKRADGTFTCSIEDSEVYISDLVGLDSVGEDEIVDYAFYRIGPKGERAEVFAYKFIDQSKSK